MIRQQEMITKEIEARNVEDIMLKNQMNEIMAGNQIKQLQSQLAAQTNQSTPTIENIIIGIYLLE